MSDGGGATGDWPFLLSDVMMPGLDGFGLVRAIRADPRTRAVPIILLSARAGDEPVVKGLASGADDYLVKPFSARELMARCSTQLEMARVRRDVARHELAAEELREAVRTRDDWLVLVSHELRTPVTALALGLHSLVRGLVTVREPPLSQELLRTRAENAEKLLHRLEARIEDLVSTSELVAGQWTPALEEVDLTSLVSAVAMDRRAAAARAGCSLEVTTTGPVTGSFDRARLFRAIGHLVDNALKFGAGRPVRLVVSEIDGHGVIEVEDRGPGIPAEARTPIFDRFARGVPVDHYGGLGVGLWVARHVVEALQGTLEVDETEGGGATFTVELPLSAQARHDLEQRG